MARIKRYNNETGAWEYCNTGTMPIKGIDYLSRDDYDDMKSDITAYAYRNDEIVEVTVVGNQSTSSTDLLGSVVSVVKSDGTIIGSNTWNGASIDFGVKTGTQYYVSVDASAQGYSSFVSDIYTATASNTRMVEAECNAELLTVNVSGAEGFIITISGGYSATQTTAGGTYLIPFGVEYTISASSVYGYITPSSVTYTANSTSRSVAMTYVEHPGTTNPSNGVYIKDTEGYYYTSDAWDGTYTADCVAVITSSCRFGIALTEASSAMPVHSSYSGSLENYITAITDSSSAKADYNGEENTTNIMKLQSSTSYAAGWCNAFPFPSSKNGFLPSLGQMWIAYNNKTTVDTALVKAGGAALTSTYYWTSTFKGLDNSSSNIGRNCWIFYWSDGNVGGRNVSYYSSVRAFCSL